MNHAMVIKETAVSIKLLKATRELLLTNDFCDIKISHIVSKAEVGQGSFYKYFSNPYDVFRVLKANEEDKCWDSLIQYFSRTSSGTFSQKIERMAVYLIHYINSSLDFRKIVGDNASLYNCIDKMCEADSEEQEQFNRELYEYAAAAGMSEEQARMNVHFLFTTAARYLCTPISGQKTQKPEETRQCIRNIANRLFPEA